MKTMLMAVFTALSLVCSAQTYKDTRVRVDALKSAIPYPKYNIGDTLFISFINDPEVATDKVRATDVFVIKVRIFDMMLYNTIGGKNFQAGVFLGVPIEEFPLKWKYQFIDTSLPTPKYGDCSDFYDEDRFFTDPKDAANSLITIQ